MDKMSNLHKAVSAGEIKTVKALLKQGMNVNAIDPCDGNTPLHLTVKNNNKDILKLLIDNGADIRIKNNEGFTTLQCALAQQKLNSVKTLIEAGDDINTRDKYGRTTLHWAAMRNHTQLVQNLLSRHADINIKNNNGETALQYACHKVPEKKSFDLTILTTLIKAGSNVNEKDEVGRTPLHWAAINDNVSLAEKLISCDADLNLKNNAGETVLQSAFNNNSIETAKILINAGGDVKSKDHHGQTALHYAVKDRNLAVIENILSRDADVNSRDNLGQTALHLAVKINDKSLVKYLLSHKANVNIKNDLGETVLQHAFDQNDYELAKILISAKGEIGNRIKCGRTNLHLAAEQNNFAAVSKFLTGRANLNVQDKNKLTSLHLAVIYNDKQSHLAVLQLLLKNKLDVDVLDNLGNTALLLAAKYCSTEIVKNFLSAKANPNLKNHQSESPLSYALERKLLDMAIILIDAGAQVHTTNSRGQTALHLAVDDENIVFVKKLLSCGAKVCLRDNKGIKAIDYLNRNSKNFQEISYLLQNSNSNADLKDIEKLRYDLDGIDINLTTTLIQNGCNIQSRSTRSGRSAMHLAAQCNDVQFIESLLSRGADVNTSDNESRTPLHVASIFNNHDSHLDIIENLLSHNADVNAQDDEGKTCLHILAAKSSPESMKLLLNYEADVSIKSNEGFTAMQYALDSRICYIIRILVDARANVNSKSTITGDTALHLFTLEKDFNQHKMIMIKELLARGANVNAKNNQSKTALEYLIDDCEFDLAKILVDAGANVNSRGKFGRTLLHLAVEKNEIPMVKYLLSSGADPNMQTFNNNLTPLHIAACFHEEEKNWRLIKLLLENNANLSIQDTKGITPFQILVLDKQNLTVVKILFDAGGDVNSRGVNGETALHLAVRKNKTAMVQYLLSRGANVNVRDNNNETPLHYATRKGQSHLNVTNVLLDNNADVNLQNLEGMTVLHMSAKSLDSKLIKLFLNRSADFNIKNNVGQTAVQYVLHNLDVAKIFIVAGVDVNVRDTEGRTVLHWAAYKCNATLLNYFLSSGANVDAIDNGKFTPLLLAVVHNKNNSHMKVIKVLLAKKPDIYVQNICGNTFLHHIAREANFKTFELLLTDYLPLDFSIRNKGGETVLQYAIRHGQLEMAKFGIMAGGDINSKDIGEGGGSTALHLAVLKNNAETVEFFLSQGADIDAKTDFNVTPLYFAIMTNRNDSHMGLIKLLLTNKADVNAQDNFGDTVLHYLVKLRDCKGLKVLKVLLDLRKDDFEIDIKNDEGNTPLQCAIDEDNFEIVKLLIGAGGDINTQGYINGRTASHLAVIDNDVETMRNLMTLGADINIKDDSGRTPLFLALFFNSHGFRSSMIETLLANNKIETSVIYSDEGDELYDVKVSTIGSKVDLKLKNPEGFTALEVALNSLDMTTAKFLIFEAKEDVNTKSPKLGHTALWLAVHKHDIPTIKKLLSVGADINVKKDNDCTPLMAAVSSNKNDIHLKTITVLLKNKADSNVLSKNGRTALHYSAKCNSLNVVEMLIDSGVDIGVRDKDGLTALHLALEEKNLGMAKILLDAGQNINCVNSKGETALHLAVKENNIPLIKHFLTLGADINVKNYSNKTAVMCASKINRLNVTKILVGTWKSRH